MKVLICALCTWLLFTPFSFAGEPVNKEVLHLKYKAAVFTREDWNTPLVCTVNLSVADDFSIFYRDDETNSNNTIGNIYKNLPKNDYLTFKGIVHLRGKVFTYSEPMPQFDWQIQDGDSTVCGYRCQKAQTTFRGRTWTVWYTMDLPYSDGPWKLCGLPGLILKATDSKDRFQYTAIEISKGSGEEIKAHLKGTKELKSAKDYAKEIKKYAKDPDTYIGRVPNPNYTFIINGVVEKDTPTPSFTPIMEEIFDLGE